MKIDIKLNKVYPFLLLCATLGAFTGCQPEDAGDGNGLTSANIDASFTITPVTGKTNTYALKANEVGVISVKWDKGTGSATLGKAIDTIALPDAGVYSIKLTAVGKGGEQKTTAQDITVATSDPIAGNLVVGGKMETADAAKWTQFTIGAGVSFAISNGKMTATGGSWGHAGIYQAIQVVAGKKYQVDMLVSGSGASDTWFEVYVSATQPSAGVDYTAGGNRLGLNTWNGCGNATFSGKLTAIGCSGTGKGLVEFTQSGTVYLVIKTGGNNLGTTGISMDNVEFRGTK